jgi:glycine/D-amino acid oxidase-like deaminating enzyme
VWDLDRGLYFRPTPKGILASPCDKRFVRLGKPLKGSSAGLVNLKARQSLLRKLKSFNPFFKLGKLGSQKAGLRTMAPDGRFIIGEDPKLKNFYWVAGLGGHGVTTSFSVGDLAARLVLGKRTDPGTVRWASAKRFAKK